MNCKRCQSELPNLLLDAQAVPSAVFAHVAGCPVCAAQLNDLRATMNTLNHWTAPAPTAYFDTRLHARLREEMAAPPEGFFERLRSRLLFNTNHQLRPLMAGALALVLIAGGGTYAGFDFYHPQQQESAAVNDLQILDKNAQAIDQMSVLLQDDEQNDGGAQTTQQMNP
jgi:hypothetical protein